MGKWQLPIIGVFLVIFAVTVLLTGEAIYLIPIAILAALVAGYALFNRAMTKRIEERHDSLEDAMSDEEEPLPSAHLIPDNQTPAGDTPEAHDEINPHDLPPDHPGRQEAEAQAGGEEGTTRGDEELLDVGPDRDESLEPSGEQRLERGG
jgi:nitrogen fixation-related uncharacterized protein